MAFQAERIDPEITYYYGWRAATMQETLDFLLRHGYLVLFLFVFAEQIGVPLPAIPFLLAAGALTRSGHLEPLPAVALAAAASIVADAIWYEIGRRRGASALRWLCRFSLEPDSCVRVTEGVFARHGAQALLVAKFVPGLNTAAPPLAGVLRMHPLRFALYDLAGALLWIGAFFGLGYAFSTQLEGVAAWAVGLGSALGVVLFGPLAAYLTWKYLRRRRALREIQFGRIDPEELRDLLENRAGIVVVDMRHSLEVASDPRSIPGALHLPSEQFRSRHSEIPRDREIILFCTWPNEYSSARAALALVEKGIRRVRPLAGGLEAWRERGFPVEPLPGFAPAESE